MGQPRPDRVGQDDAHAGAMGLQEPADAGDRTAGPDTADERPDPPAALLENFRAGRRLMDARVGRVGELVGQEPALLHRPAGERRSGSSRAKTAGRLAVTMTSAPTAARATRLSTDIFSGSTQTSR